MSSDEFKQLRTNITALKAAFLNFAKRIDGEYTEEERLKCRAFIAFSHAEFEYYMESVSLRILDEAMQNWQKKKEFGVVAAAVLAFRHREKTAVPDNPKQPGDNTLATILMASFKAQKVAINGNNGIKPKNFAEIYTPLGITSEDVEEALLIQLSNSGSHRGDMVHTSVNVSLPLVRDPFADEERDIDFLLEEMNKFDARLEGICSCETVAQSSSAALACAG